MQQLVYIFTCKSLFSYIGTIFDEHKTPIVEKPRNVQLTKGIDKDFGMNMAILGEDLNGDVKYRYILKDNIRKLYSLICGEM